MIEEQGMHPWIPFYEEFADKLLGFAGSRRELIDIALWACAQAGLKEPRLDSVSPPADIDPFTVFGLFNKGISDANRKAVMAALADALGMAPAVPESFDGVPVLNNMNATFYRFTGDPSRGDGDVDDLWALFAAAIAYADEPAPEAEAAFCTAFGRVRGLKGNRWKLTMGLYWARPRSFLNLDSRNRWFIGEMGPLPAPLREGVAGLREVPDAASYLEICREVAGCIHGDDRCPDLPSLSYEAWVVSEKVNEENRRQASGKAAEEAVLPDARGTRYWLYSPGAGACMWDELRERGEMSIGWEEIGDLSQYASKDAMRAAMREKIDPSKSFKHPTHATWQFANEMRPGDVVYAKRGLGEVVGRGVVASGYRFAPERGADRSNVRDVEWTHSGSWEHPGQAAVKTLTDITPYRDYVEKLEALFGADGDRDDGCAAGSYPAYTKDEFLEDVFMGEEDYDELAFLVATKKNVILQGAPGVGKTYCAKRLAYSLMGQMDSSRVMTVQFHQSYSYEDFVEGYRPSGAGFELRKGPFYRFCKLAEVDSDNAYYFIIDEINRGNLGKVFGELFMLIEADKRGVGLSLMYSDEEFSVPGNVHIIGMMNTADRSLAMLDYALRRRFAFFDLRPGFDSDGFASYASQLGSAAFDSLVDAVRALNREIAADDSLGEGFCIGHSYFCGLEPGEAEGRRLASIVDYELVPLLREYWYDEPSKAGEWAKRLRAAAGAR